MNIFSHSHEINTTEWKILERLGNVRDKVSSIQDRLQPLIEKVGTVQTLNQENIQEFRKSLDLLAKDALAIKFEADLKQIKCIECPVWAERLALSAQSLMKQIDEDTEAT